jgi:hypothetical protein
MFPSTFLKLINSADVIYRARPLKPKRVAPIRRSGWLGRLIEILLVNNSSYICCPETSTSCVAISRYHHTLSTSHYTGIQPPNQARHRSDNSHGPTTNSTDSARLQLHISVQHLCDGQGKGRNHRFRQLVSMRIARRRHVQTECLLIDVDVVPRTRGSAIARLAGMSNVCSTDGCGVVWI